MKKEKATAELAEFAERRMCFCVLSALCGCFLFVSSVTAQTTRLAVLQAEDRRAMAANDLAIIRAGAHSGDPQTTQLAVRALGRLERPSLIADISTALRHPLPEIRAEAANAVGQAAQGWKNAKPSPPVVDGVVAMLTARLKIEAEPDVRSAICETIGRLPYTTAAQAEGAERTLIDAAARNDAIADRLGVAQGLESLARVTRQLRSPSNDAITLLTRLTIPGPRDAVATARVRRLALEALITAAAMTADVRAAAARDPDAQVRRLAMRAAAATTQPASDGDAQVLKSGLADGSPMVRSEALRGLALRGANRDPACAAANALTTDAETQVALVALDQLSACGASPEAVARLVRTVEDVSDAGSPRGWHRAAHALVSLAAAAPERGAAALPPFTRSRIWPLRMYAARAAATVKNREVLVALAADDNDNVREAAVEGLRRIAAHEVDATYIAGLSRQGYQVVRVSALALEGTPHPDQAVPALKAAWQRLVAEGKDNSYDARDAIARTLTSLGATPAAVRRGPTRVGPGSDPGRTLHNDLTAEDLRRLASPRARVTIRGVGMFELALFTTQAPATTLRFARLAQDGYYDGLTFHRVVPNFVIQGGSPGANEYVGDATFMRDEVGLWPHVRGAVGISTRGRDTGDAQLFIDLVDNPRLDHEYTVFAQVLNGMEVVDRILESDVIEKIEIVVGQ